MRPPPSSNLSQRGLAAQVTMVQIRTSASTGAVAARIATATACSVQRYGHPRKTLGCPMPALRSPRKYCPASRRAFLKAGSYLPGYQSSTTGIPRECTGIATGMHRDCHENAPALPRVCHENAPGVVRDVHRIATRCLTPSYERETTVSSMVPRSSYERETTFPPLAYLSSTHPFVRLPLPNATRSPVLPILPLPWYTGPRSWPVRRVPAAMFVDLGGQVA